MNKKKKSFPDLTGDGKITQADILKGRGVFSLGGQVVTEVKVPNSRQQIQGFGAVRSDVKNFKGKA